MADPRSFIIKPCREQAGGKANARRSFFNAVGKVGDLEVLNSIGGSKIGQGLRNLAKISNTVRTGCGSLPTSIGSAIDTGANWVLENVGIAPTIADVLRDFNPGIVNNAVGQAKQIYEQVKRGTFRATDIPDVLQDLQNLERLGRNIYTPSNSERRAFEVCGDISPYAIDLISRAPKYKFLFVVEVIFNHDYAELRNLDFAFVVKNTTRPNVKIQMEDVNYYNFRSKVITKTEFDEMRMSFHDDAGFGLGGNSVLSTGEIGNYALRFYNAYMRATAPITNLEDASQLSLAEQQGMAFDSDAGSVEGVVPTKRYTASRGTLAGDVRNIIREIRLFHVYNYGNSMNVYKFFNPRITALMLDDLDMSSSTEGAEVSMSFNYDSVYIDTGVPVEDAGYALSNLTSNGRYPLRYNSVNGSPIPNDTAPFGTPGTTSGSCSTTINNRSSP